jgi:hypothetical protein
MVKGGGMCRWFTVFLGFLLASLVSVGQESHVSTSVNSVGPVEVDLTQFGEVSRYSLTIRNNSWTSIAAPWVTAPGSVSTFDKESLLKFIRAKSSNDEQFAIQTWQFVLDHFGHFCSAGSIGDKYRFSKDPSRLLNGYGMGCCDQTSLVLAWIWDGGGYPTRIANMNFHTVPEIYYEGAWHMLDPDHRTFYRALDGSVASVEQIVNDKSIIENTGNADGKDPVGYAVGLMAQLYVDNFLSLQYFPLSYFAPQEPQLLLAPKESIEIKSYNPAPDSFYYDTSGGLIRAPAQAFASTIIRRPVSYSDPLWSRQPQSYSSVSTYLTSNGRSALTSTSSSGYVVYSEQTPFPMFSLIVSGEFQLTDPSGSLAVSFSADNKVWSPFVSVPFNASSGSQFATVDLTGYGKGYYGYYLKFKFNRAVSIYELEIRSESQVSSRIVPSLSPGQINTLQYTDSSPASLARSISLDFSVVSGKPEIPMLSAESLVPESVVYSTARNYQARRLVDKDTSTLAYPGATNIDYVIHLNGRFQLSQVSLWWGQFGSNTAYINNWKLMANDGTAGWKVVSSGDFPAGGVTDVAVSAIATDLRVVASSSSNWIGIYELKAYGDELTPFVSDPNRTIISNVPEDRVYSIGRNYGAANLLDGNLNTLAYPGSSRLDYQIHLSPSAVHVRTASIHWGYFGTIPGYVNQWSLLSQNGSDWTPVATGSFPGTENSSIALDTQTTQLRLVATSNTNWIGAYEIGIGANPELHPVSVSSNVPGPYASSLGPENLMDDNRSSLAYPGSTFVDYQLDFGSNCYIDQMKVTWGYFGSTVGYVDDWAIYGQRDGDASWVLVSRGIFPNTDASTVDISRTFRKLRVAASSNSNWIGIFEIIANGTALK